MTISMLRKILLIEIISIHYYYYYYHHHHHHYYYHYYIVIIIRVKLNNTLNKYMIKSQERLVSIINKTT